MNSAVEMDCAAHSPADRVVVNAGVGVSATVSTDSRHPPSATIMPSTRRIRTGHRIITVMSPTSPAAMRHRTVATRQR